MGDYGYGPDGKRLSGDRHGTPEAYGPDGRRLSGNKYGPESTRKGSSGSTYDPDGRKLSGEKYGPDGRRLGDYAYDGRKASGVTDPDGRKSSSESNRYGSDGRRISDGRHSDHIRPGSRSEVRSPYGSRPGSRSDLYNQGQQQQQQQHPHERFPPIELNNVPLPSTGGDVDSVVRTPSGGLAYPYVEDNGNGSIGLSYQPVERGPHSIDVRYDGDHVQGSPYKFYAAPLDDNRVHAYGPGLTHGVCGDPAEFVISTRGAGAGGLALAVEGPSKADINCQVSCKTDKKK